MSTENPKKEDDKPDKSKPVTIEEDKDDDDDEDADAGVDEKRESWGNAVDFLMSVIASSVGLGNVWRFPAICAHNGGAAFLIPYWIVVIVIACPLLTLEVSLGQFCSKGSVRCWELSPIFTGIGISGMIATILLSTFYIMLMGWSLAYLCFSFSSMVIGDVVWGNETGRFFGGTFLHAVDFDSPQNMELQSWVPLGQLMICLMLAWLIVWLIMARGMASSGKVAYATALLPYVVLIVLMTVGFTLKGFEAGVLFFLVPDFNGLLEPDAWYNAVGQCFFSLGVGLGAGIMFSSYNDFRANIFRNCIIICVVDTFTSIIAGLSLMSILGFQATRSYEKELKDYQDGNDNKSVLMRFQRMTKEELKILGHCDIDDKTNPSQDDFEGKWKRCRLLEIVKGEGGAGLAFVQYPLAMYEINEAWGKHFGGVFGVMFFFMLIMLAAGSANGLVGTTVTIIHDVKPHWSQKRLVSVICLATCLVGSILYCSGIGAEWFDVIDHHGVQTVAYVAAFFEVIAVMWVYGMKSFMDDYQFMQNKSVNWYLRITWVALPFLLFAIFVIYCVKWNPQKTWTIIIIILAWTMSGLILLTIPGTALYMFIKFKRHPWRRHVAPTCWGTFKAICRPNPKWGPKDPEIRAEWRKFKHEQSPSFKCYQKICEFLHKICSRRPAPAPEPKMSIATNAYTPSQAVSYMSNPEGSAEPETPEVKPEENKK